MNTPQSVAGLPLVVRVHAMGVPGARGAPGSAAYPTKAAATAAASAAPPTLTGPTMVFIDADETLGGEAALYHYDGTTFRQVAWA
jgi:hypothetical protein